MKNILFVFGFMFLFVATSFAQGNLNLQSGTPDTPAQTAKFKWLSKTEHDFGKIPQDVPATVKYEFTNEGEAPLIITNVKPSCGCTTPDYTKEPIKKGEKGFITATYNAHNAGSFIKTVTVTANTEEQNVTLRIQGEVLPKPADSTGTPTNSH